MSDYWESEARRLDDERDRLTNDILDQGGELSRAKAEIVELKAEATAMQSRLDGYREAMELANKRIRELEDLRGSQAKAVSDALAIADDLRAEVARLRESIEDLHLEHREELIVIGMAHGEE